MSIHQKLDVAARTVVKNIVDGQQRSRAIQDFYEGRIRLSRNNIDERFAGMTFAELDEPDQAQFLNYGLNFDVFVGATDEQVREVFRRMNSFTVPLNPEEKRHAEFQGPFKWFMYNLTRDFDDALEIAGIFSTKQLYRMQDAKLFTEVVKAMLDGITTTSAKSLNDLYKKFDEAFPEQAEADELPRNAIRFVLTTEEVRDTALMKPYNVYALLLAHVQANGWSVGTVEPVVPDVAAFQRGEAGYNLSILASASGSKGAYDGENASSGEGFAEFVSATTERTNVLSRA